MESNNINVIQKLNDMKSIINYILTNVNKKLVGTKLVHVHSYMFIYKLKVQLS